MDKEQPYYIGYIIGSVSSKTNKITYLSRLNPRRWSQSISFAYVFKSPNEAEIFKKNVEISHRGTGFQVFISKCVYETSYNLSTLPYRQFKHLTKLNAHQVLEGLMKI